MDRVRPCVDAALAELKERLAEITDLVRIASVLEWDMEVFMPPAGADARGTQLSTVKSLIHRQTTDDRIGELLEELGPYAASLPDDADDAALVRVARRRYDKLVRIPPELTAELTKAKADGYATWVTAREAGDFSAFRPALERLLDIKLRMVECFAPYDDAYDVLIDDFEEGLRSEEITRIFEILEPELTALVDEHAGEPDELLRGPFPVGIQDALSREVIEAFGVTWDAFRLDLTVHPFAETFGLRDIRLTTRYDETDLNSLFTAMHEAGHGMYEAGSSPSLDRTPLAGCSSSSLHESQSRLWENVVGRSLPFWRWLYPRVQEVFPERLGPVSLERFHEAINRPQRSFIRVDADETSYGLHVMLRYELERELVFGRLAVADLPDAWNTRFHELLGLDVPNDRVGVLQDSHWSTGYFGYFPTYLLGSVLSVQVWERAAAAIPDVEEQIERGDFRELHGWLRDNLYALGNKYTPTETVERVVGGPIEPGPYLEYLRGKLGALSAA
jgi:carboxypeptidase Taq